MRKTNKENIILTTTNINTITKTPIEIALKIDKNDMTSLKNLLTKLEENQIKIQKSLPKKKFSYWSTKMFPKYQLLTDYFNISNRELYKELFKELKNTYPDIELNQIVDDYCYENKLDSCFTLDAIEHDKTTRQLFEDMVNNLMLKYNLMPEERNYRRNSIFDD